MKKNIVAAIALALAFLPLADSAYAQANVAGKPNRPQASNDSVVPTPKVCFYTATNHKGLFFCETGVRSVSMVPAQWRNQIKSITVSDNTTVRVCSADILQENCTVIGKDVEKLEPGLFNKVRSYDIRQAY